MLQENKPSGLLLDTHIWVRYINGDPKLKPAGVALIEAARKNGEAFVSVISIWEIAFLVKKGRLNLPVTVDRWVNEALLLPGVRLLALTPEIAIESVQLSDALNKDLSDRILVASVRVEGLRLMSRDKDVLRFAKQISLPMELA